MSHFDQYGKNHGNEGPSKDFRYSVGLNLSFTKKTLPTDQTCPRSPSREDRHFPDGRGRRPERRDSAEREAKIIDETRDMIENLSGAYEEQIQGLNEKLERADRHIEAMTQEYQSELTRLDQEAEFYKQQSEENALSAATATARAAALAKPAAEAEGLRSKLAKAERQIGEMEHLLKATEIKGVYEMSKMRAEIGELAKKLTDERNENEQAQGELLAGLKSKIEHLVRKLDLWIRAQEDRKILNRASKAPETKVESIAPNSEEMERLNHQLKEAKSSLIKARQEVERLHRESEEKGRSATTILAERNGLKDELAKAKAESADRASLKAEAVALRQAVATRDQSLRHLSERAKKLEAEAQVPNGLKEENSRLKAELEEARNQLKLGQIENVELRVRAEKRLEEVERLRGENNTLLQKVLNDGELHQRILEIIDNNQAKVCFMQEYRNGWSTELTEACRVLGLDPNASFEEIKSAHRSWAQILHPDRLSPKLAKLGNEALKKVNAAYEILEDFFSGKIQAGFRAQRRLNQ